jgi:mannosyltransferase OCH1-like enzyme
MPKIPKIIHQIWLGPKPVPVYIQQIKDMNPSWDHKLWREEDVEKLKPLKNQKHYDALINQYEILHSKCPRINNMHFYAGRADLLRLEILFSSGGFFVDADSLPLQEFPDFLLDNDSFSVYENEQLRGNLVANGYLGATKHNFLMEWMIQELKRLPDINVAESWQVSGPQFLTNMIKKYRYEGIIKIYPSHYFIPNHYSNVQYSGNDKEHIYCDQLWGSTRNLY